MEEIKISDIVRITGGVSNYTDDVFVTGVQTDSRRISKGDMYVALIGARVDGHDFIKNAADAGAVCALVSRDVENSPIPTVKVASPEESLRDIARAYFSMISPKVIAVTGSCGKTTTKEMLSEVFSTKYNTLKTNGNYNSTIGLPLTVCRLSKENNVAVLEMGTGHKGEIKTMCSVVKPDIAIITNIGSSHIEFFGSKEAIANEKCDIYRAVSPIGTIVVNADDEMISKIMSSEVFPAKQITYGINAKADVTASNIETFSTNGAFLTEFDINYLSESVHAKINTLGIHNVYNALAASAAGLADGITLDDIVRGLAEFIPDDMRMKVFKCIDGVTLISDVYNSNPQAVKASLKVMSDIAKGRKIAILGDMLEQGDFSEEAHTDIGRYAAQFANILISRGDMAIYTSGGAAEFMPYKSIQTFHTNEDVTEYLSTFDFRYDDTFLVKGSRGMKMEEIVNYILEQRFNCAR